MSTAFFPVTSAPAVEGGRFPMLSPNARGPQMETLPWAEGLAMRAYGVSFGLRISEPGWWERIQPMVMLGWAHAPTAEVDQLFSLVVGDSTYSLFRGDEKVGEHQDLDLVLDSLKSEIRLWVAEHATERVFVHAGVVEWHGRAIIVPGRSYSGKSTLVAELLRAGATYYSDEFAVLDDEGRVHPFALPLSIRQPGQMASTPATPASFGAATGREPIPVGAVAVARYRKGAHWRPRKVSRGEGALALMANTVSARRNPVQALTTLRTAMADAVVMRGTRGEASAAATKLIELSERAS